MENSRFKKDASKKSQISVSKSPDTSHERKGWLHRMKGMLGGKEPKSKEGKLSARKQNSKENLRQPRTINTTQTTMTEEATRNENSGEHPTVKKTTSKEKVVSKERVKVSREKPSRERGPLSKEETKSKAQPAPPPPVAQGKAKPRKRPSFNHDQRVKTTKDIQGELEKQRRSKVGANENVFVATNERRYEKKELIAKGKREMVYAVQDTKAGCKDIKLAVKCSDAHAVTNNEIRFLLEFQQTLRNQVSGSDHILPICSYGATEEYSWLIQPLCGPNLDQLRVQMDAEFSPQTALRLGLMALDAIACLHRCNVVHGRIEPQHFVIGCDSLKCNLYLVGLGHIAQSATTQNFVWSKTPAYAPSRAYKELVNTEIETWLYLMLDLYGRSFLPWNKRRWGPEEIQKWKEQMFMFPVLLPSHFPPLFHDLFMIIGKCEDSESTTIRVIRRRLLDYLKQNKMSRQTPFEWETSPADTEAMKAAKDPARCRIYMQKGRLLRERTKKILKDYHSQEGES